MFDVLLVTHGRLGEELIATARLVFGEVGEGVSAIGFRPGESPDALAESIAARVSASAPAAGCLVLCDILGGSPFLMAARCRQGAERPMEVVSGLNLAMLVEVLAQRDCLGVDEGARVAVEAARQSIRNLSEQLS